MDGPKIRPDFSRTPVPAIPSSNLGAGATNILVVIFPMPHQETCDKSVTGPGNAYECKINLGERLSKSFIQAAINVDLENTYQHVTPVDRCPKHSDHFCQPTALFLRANVDLQHLRGAFEFK